MAITANRLQRKADPMSPFRTKTRWKEGTYMRLTSPERFATFVFTGQDLKDIKAGKPVPIKMTQRRLAKRSGVSQTTISRLTGATSRPLRSVKPQTAEAIAEVLGVDVTVLFDPETVSETHRLTA
ncbi:helix-turn-helix domain-containing protein [Zhihengliuella flava]|uniref:DNA-binding XRE family transcriptional regulator n=1 Tax=Zhihengliuella flava TaxID=1285193 RepID=A0A931DFE5_9MICC|nr:helix-turn-helix transcriptional regulator [Zhihengliuella flava]MBG6085860.1 DNA-binding XRE family transcriptional regulator [Zhihengliuella flava]